MSYSISTICHGCAHFKEGCTDFADIQEAVTKIHNRPYGTTHKGAGSIAILCCRRTDVIKEEPKEE